MVWLITTSSMVDTQRKTRNALAQVHAMAIPAETAMAHGQRHPILEPVNSCTSKIMVFKLFPVRRACTYIPSIATRAGGSYSATTRLAITQFFRHTALEANLIF